MTDVELELVRLQKEQADALERAARLVHTETTYFNAVAARECYKDLDVESVEILETLDGKTCGVGSDIAVDAADIALVDDEVKELPQLFALSKRMMTTIKLNLTFSMTLNFVAIALAITGVLNPVFGALVHNAGSIAVIVNSALLLKWSMR